LSRNVANTAVVADEHDKRNRLVALTEAGWAKLAQSQPLWEEAQRRFERAFGEEKARAFRATLDYIASPECAPSTTARRDVLARSMMARLSASERSVCTCA
jgi:DNA-binding MarR family transcriptional regulator